MATSSGPIATQEENLNELIKRGNVALALPIIASTALADLQKRDKYGYEPIHWAATHGHFEIFQALIKKGIDPFTPNKDGYSPYYIARQNRQGKKIFELYKEYMPELFNEQDVPADHGMADALADGGFHPYYIKISPVNEKDLDKKQILGLFLAQLLQDGRMPPFFPDAPKLAQGTETLVDTVLLTKVAEGSIEDVMPTETLALLTAIYPKLQRAQKMACVYLVRELIRLDSENEWAHTKAFKEQLRALVDGIENALVFGTIKDRLQKYHAFRAKRDHLESAEDLAVDLTKLFGEAMRDLTPLSFRWDSMKSRDGKDFSVANPAFHKITALTTQLSNLVSMDIVSAASPEKAAGIKAFYLDVISYCLQEHREGPKVHPQMTYNYAAALAISAGLWHAAVSRLDKDATLLLPQHRALLQKHNDALSPFQNYKFLRELIRKNPICIQPLGLYCADKDKIDENAFHDKILMMGEQNSAFRRQRDHLVSLPDLRARRFRTDLPESLAQFEKVEFNDEEALKRSYTLEPSTIIDIGQKPGLDSIFKDLSACLSNKAPLVVKDKGQLYRAEKARAQLSAFLREQYNMRVTFTDDDDAPDAKKMKSIMELCGKVIVAFKRSGIQRLDIDELTDVFARKLRIGARSRDAKRQSKTTDDLPSEFKSLSLIESTIPEEESATVDAGSSAKGPSFSISPRPYPKESELKEKRRRLMVKSTKGRAFTPLSDAKKQSQSSPQFAANPLPQPASVSSDSQLSVSSAPQPSGDSSSSGEKAKMKKKD